jgi:hypothetical protein
MSAPANCSPCCSSETTTQIVGPQGDPGDDGADGQNAYTVIATSAVTIGAVGASITVTVASSEWMAIGQVVILSDGTKKCHMQVTAKPAVTQFTGTFLGYQGDDTSGSIAVGGVVSPAGVSGTINQAAAVTLVAGTKNITGVSISATSIIFASLYTPAGTRTGFAGYKITSVVQGLNGTGSFTMTAIDDSAATLASCTDVVNYLIVG